VATNDLNNKAIFAYLGTDRERLGPDYSQGGRPRQRFCAVRSDGRQQPSLRHRRWNYTDRQSSLISSNLIL